MKNKVLILFSSCALAGLWSCSAPVYQQPDAPIQEVPFTQVHIEDQFWSPRIETNRTVPFLRLSRNARRMGDSTTLRWLPV